jgi:hypothetical protein
MSQNHPFKFLTTFLFYFDFILNVWLKRRSETQTS